MSLSNYIKNGFPSLAKHGHYERTRKMGRGPQQTCDNPECPCQKVEKMKQNWEK
jgi:hypothetical protein